MDLEAFELVLLRLPATAPDYPQAELEHMSADLRKLLTVAVPGALVRDTEGGFVMEVDYFHLPRLC